MHVILMPTLPGPFIKEPQLRIVLYSDDVENFEKGGHFVRRVQNNVQSLLSVKSSDNMFISLMILKIGG